MIRFLTAGESHGKALTVIIDGFPSNLQITKEYMDIHLKRRQAGYGRGLRMKIESDTAEILSGIRHGKTLGSPISFLIKNKEWEKWENEMSPEAGKTAEKVTVPRPGHADLTGTLKYNFDDIRNSIERSSARETAARTAAGTVARKFLEEFGIKIGSFTESIGGVYSKENYYENLLNSSGEGFDAWELSEKSERSEVKVLDELHEKRIINKIKQAKKNGDTLGGTFVVAASGVPAGLGSYMQYDRKLNVDITGAVMSINAVKGVEIGSGFSGAEMYGSQVHDEIIFNGNGFSRKSNRSGGIEGGISTGLPLLARAAMKPISTLMSPLDSVELKSLEPVPSRRERSDFVAVPACAVIAEAMLAWVIAGHFLEKFGGDSMEEIKDRYKLYNKNLLKSLKRNFK